ncbi:MAG: hypothetical protein GX136_04010 [Clostridiales bacterium]|jgi:hypothetical protein|nr:hypothetical protein [Clostridiales bacterium]
MAVKRDTTIRRRKPPRPSTEDAQSNPDGPTLTPVRRRRRRNPFLRALARLTVVAVLIFCGVLLWQNWDLIEPESVIYWINDKLAGGQSGDGFPVDINGSSVLNMEKTKDGLALLTDTSLVVFNQKGGEVFRRQHGFSNPILRTNGRWLLMADVGGNRLKIETRASTPIEMKLDNYITSASIAGNGNFAVVTGSSSGYASEVMVYNRKKEIIYGWCDKELSIFDAALSPDGKSMAVVGIQAESGAMKSFLKIFDFDKMDPVSLYEGTDVMLLSVGYFPNGTVAAVGDRELWVMNKKGTIQSKHNYEDRQLAGYVLGDSSISVALRDYGGSQSGTVMTVNPSGDLAYTMPFKGAFRSLASYNSGILLLTSDHLYRADTAGTRYTADPIRDGRMVSHFGKRVIVLGLTSLSECDLPTAADKN